MNLVGKKVISKVFGTGTVSAQEGNKLIVNFSQKISKFEYKEETFKKFLIAEDPAVQEGIIKEFEEITKIAELRRKEEELAKKKAEEKRLAAEEVVKVAKQGRANASKPIMTQERIPGRRMTFYVFQGGTFDQESRGGYIWAPVSGKDGNSKHHWERLLEVQPGDIILHGCDAHVQAVSVARSKCYEYNKPTELHEEDQWEQEGRRVDCEYITFEHPIRTAPYKEDIIRLCQMKYAPFDKDGNGNMGYLFEIKRELAQIFMRNVVKYNPGLGNVDFIAELLAEEL